MTTTDDIDVQRLAQEVIRLAVLEAAWKPKGPARSRSVAIFHGICAMRRSMALTFLRCDDFICHVADVDPQRIRCAIFERHGLHRLESRDVVEIRSAGRH